jgi:hypothetical protein
MFFIELCEYKFHICTWNLHSIIYGLNHFQYNKLFFRVYIYLKLLHMCLNLEYKINKTKNKSIKINEKINS